MTATALETYDPRTFRALTFADVTPRFRDGTDTPRAYLERCLETIATREPVVQAFAALNEAGARAAADASTVRWQAGRPLSAIDGLPIGIKDLLETRDMPTQMGCEAYRGHFPKRDNAAVWALRQAGAVILGKTVTTECAYFTPGKTRNPHNSEHTPGGSSSGSAAAVAAGMVPLALGSQTNGSMIRPASFCGVYGFKPTHGLIPRNGILPLSRTLDHVGVFARTLEDLALVAEEIAGCDERDPDTRPRARIPFRVVAGEEPPIAPVIAFMKTPVWERAEGDTKEAFAELVQALGGCVEEVELFPSAADAWDWHKIIMEAEMAANLEPEWERGRSKLSKRLRELIERGREVRAVDYQRALARIPLIRRSFEELFTQRYDAILTPAAPGTAPKGLDSTGDPVFCTLWTLSGLPAVSLPLLEGSNGLPLGVQLVGRFGFDARLLRTARWLVGKASAG
jgi:Asp-tRNA(Asn)/Glu-tRNA(Gln) amidotransferase A subunit family amidase